MKVVILHPPLYPVNHKLFDLFGKHVDLVVYNVGEYPRLHKNWSSQEFKDKSTHYEMKIFGKGAISFKTQVNPIMLYHLIKDKPDIVISVAFWIPSLYASIIKKILGYKFIITTDAIYATEKNISGIRRIIRKFICWNTNAVISASQLTSDYLESLCPKTPVFQSLQTIDINAWNDELIQLPGKNILRDELNLPQDKNILLGVGNFIDKKNWIAVFKQIANLERSFFVLIGEGELLNSYKEYINKHNLYDKVVIISKKEGRELKKYFKASDIFIFPSLYDQFGYVVPEALASGLPVLCTKYAGASSLIENGVNGYVVNPENNFGDEISLILSNLSVMSENSGQIIKNYTLENKVNEYLNILSDV